MKTVFPGGCHRSGWWMGRLSGQRLQLGHGGMQPDPIVLGGRGHEQRTVQALVIRTHPQCLPNGPFGLVGTPEPHEHVGTSESGADNQGFDLRLGAVEDGPVGTPQSGEERAPDQTHGPLELARIVAAGERHEARHVGHDRSAQSEVHTTGQMGPTFGIPT